MVRIKGVIFDLDDTLYLERDFVKSGFRYVAGEIESMCGISHVDLFDFVWSLFSSGERGDVFDKLIVEFPVIERTFNVTDLVDLYRYHKPNIALQSGVEELIAKMKQNELYLGIITDGIYISQKNKVDALNLNGLFDRILFTDIWGPEYWKPHKRAFIEIQKHSGFIGSELMYIADNPKKDFIAPNRLGWNTIRFLHKGQIHFAAKPRSKIYTANIDSESFGEIVNLLGRIL